MVSLKNFLECPALFTDTILNLITRIFLGAPLGIVSVSEREIQETR